MGAAPDSHLLQLDARARAAEPRIRDWLLTLAAALRASLSLEAVTVALRTGNIVPVTSALAAVPVPVPELRDIVEQEARAALRLVIDRHGDSKTIELRFDIHDPRFEKVANELGGRLIREVPDSIRAAVNRIVADAYRKGLHPYDFAAQVKATVGLTERQSVAVMNYASGLRERGASQAFVDKSAGRYADRLLTQRAVLIARTETIRAANLSRLLGFQEAAAQGLLADAGTVVWNAALDDRTCPACEELDGTEAPLGSPVFEGNGPPPLHPDCRCVVDLA